MNRTIKIAIFSFISGILIYPFLWTLIRDTINILFYTPSTQEWKMSFPSIKSALKSLHYSLRFGTPLLPMTIGYSIIMTWIGLKRIKNENRNTITYYAIGVIIGVSLAAVIVPIGSVKPFETVLKLFCVPGAIAGFLVAVILQAIIWNRVRNVSPSKAL